MVLQKLQLLLLCIPCLSYPLSLVSATVASIPAGGPDPSRQRPIDMQEPDCGPHAATSPCSRSMDATRPVILEAMTAAAGSGQPIPPSECDMPLMHWSPFPCAFDAKQFNGTPGQSSDLCSKALVNGQFRAVLPSPLCGPSPTGRMLAWRRQLSRVVLSLRFKVAGGRQFDRTYTMFIGDAVVGGWDRLRYGRQAKCILYRY